MAHKGKFARALSKGSREKRAPQNNIASPDRPPVTPLAVKAKAKSKAKSLEIRRVKSEGVAPQPQAVLVTDRGGEVASQIRACRAKILALNDGRPPCAITVTSGGREEGKTTIAFNLAAALSEVNPGRVLLLDGDVLNPNINKMLNINPPTGLNRILENDNLSLDGNVYETIISNLDIIPSQPVSPESFIEARLHQRCGELIDQLRRFYAFIIIDTPPVLASSQACTFGKNSDGTLMIARLERTPRHVVKRATSELIGAGANLIGCILTGHKHHVPSLIYRFFGTTPSRYYRYGPQKSKHEKTRAGAAVK